MKKILAVLLTVLLCAAGLAGCAKKQGSVYYLNFKPEQDAQWQALAAQYKKETGVPVTVVTAAAGTYESTLKSELAKREAPTLFQVNGPTGLASWKDYCYDLSGSALYSHLTNKDFSLKAGDEVLGIAYAIETYGIIYNRALLEKYGTLPDAVITAPEEIDSFATLKAVADDMQARRDELGIDGAFTSAGMDSTSDWRFKTHLANLPIYYEYKDEDISSTDAIKGTYLANFRAIWDLYITDSTTDPALLSGRTGADATAEFASGKAAFYQNGTWAYNDIATLGDENLGMLPIYIGAPGEENQGLCTGSENYWCVNRRASEEDITATVDFLNWIVTSETGRRSLGLEMGFVTPFDTFTEEYKAENPLLRAADAYLAADKIPVTWSFSTIPSDNWKSALGSAMTAYAAGTGSWDEVERAFIGGWTEEYRASTAS